MDKGRWVRGMANGEWVKEWNPPCSPQGPPGCGCAATGRCVSVAVMEQMNFRLFHLFHPACFWIMVVACGDA